MLGGPRGRVSVSAFPLALLAVVLPACCTITGVGVVVMNSGQRRGGIFISYRREETAGQAGRLYDRLSGRFGAGRVFMDVDSIAIGVDFTTAITEAVSGCDILLALIGREWLTLTDSRGQRRLDDPDDFVRVEIEAALQRDIRVVPVLVEGAVLPQAADLPTSLRLLVRRQALMLSHVGFGAEVSRLIAAVHAVLGAGPGRAADADRDTDRVAAKTGPPAGKQHAGLPVKEEQPDMARARGAPSGLEAADDPAYVDGLSALLAGRFDEAADCFTALQDRYQLTHADLPAEFPPIRTAAERTGNLPVPVSSFIGRARELEQTQLVTERTAFRLVLEQRNGHLNDHARTGRDASMITAARSEPGPGGVGPGPGICTGCADGSGSGQSKHRMGLGHGGPDARRGLAVSLAGQPVRLSGKFLSPAVMLWSAHRCSRSLVVLTLGVIPRKLPATSPTVARPPQ
jgi:TIR domain